MKLVHCASVAATFALAAGERVACELSFERLHGFFFLPDQLVFLTEYNESLWLTKYHQYAFHIVL